MERFLYSIQRPFLVRDPNFRYVRAGEQRIEALTGNPNFDPVAFINTNGKYAFVVKAATG